MLILPSDKAVARKLAAAARIKAHAQLKDQAALGLAAHAIPISPHKGFICASAFYPYKSEIDTRILLGRLAGDGWTTCLPIVVGEQQPLIFRRWYPGEPTVKDAMGIDIPQGSAEPCEPDLLIIPMLSFDRAGYRLGYGGGYYDQTLKALRAKKKIMCIGAAYSAQEAEHIPREPHDQKLDYIITEKELITCG